MFPVIFLSLCRDPMLVTKKYKSYVSMLKGIPAGPDKSILGHKVGRSEAYFTNSLCFRCIQVDVISTFFVVSLYSEKIARLVKLFTEYSDTEKHKKKGLQTKPRAFGITRLHYL